ncbi:MAG: GNAT family N-acetyltransferase [Anaerolineales bacterium]|nr:GNAT family N-acetyltransferase [Anaerolineales bacterium]
MKTTQKIILRDLGNGLVMRRSSAEDVDALSAFNGLIHGEDEADTKRLGAWTRDLLTRQHPTFHADDFLIVEESSTGRIVSSMNLIPQTWSYEGIEFGVGRPELVGTLPEYRGKGLIRVQLDEIHKWCAERGLLVQAITGIPYFYRQFGYEMALDFVGRRVGYEAQVPKLKEGEKEKYIVRPAVEADLPFIANLYERATQRHMMKCMRNLDVFQYEVFEQSRDAVHYFNTNVIEDPTGELVGYVQHSDYLNRAVSIAVWYELKQGISWLDVTPSVIRYLWSTGKEYAKRDGGECTAFGFMGGAHHPVYQALGRGLPTVHEPYAYQVRVPDLVAFLNHIKPVLEKRLAESVAAGHSREIKVSFYRDGLRIMIEKGKLSIEKWIPVPKDDEGDIAFPDHTFLQMLFGYRSFEELSTSFVECWWYGEDVRILMSILFPKKLSDVFPIA